MIELQIQEYRLFGRTWGDNYFKNNSSKNLKFPARVWEDHIVEMKWDHSKIIDNQYMSYQFQQWRMPTIPPTICQTPRPYLSDSKAYFSRNSQQYRLPVVTEATAFRATGYRDYIRWKWEIEKVPLAPFTRSLPKLYQQLQLGCDWKVPRALQVRWRRVSKVEPLAKTARWKRIKSNGLFCRVHFHYE